VSPTIVLGLARALFLRSYYIIIWPVTKDTSTHAHWENPSFMAPFDLDACIQQLLRKQLLHEALLREICEKTKEVLMRESNVVHLNAPVTVVGDIHG
jgi:hypothetical protein